MIGTITTPSVSATMKSPVRILTSPMVISWPQARTSPRPCEASRGDAKAQKRGMPIPVPMSRCRRSPAPRSRGCAGRPARGRRARRARRCSSPRSAHGRRGPPSACPRPCSCRRRRGVHRNRHRLSFRACPDRRQSDLHRAPRPDISGWLKEQREVTLEAPGQDRIAYQAHLEICRAVERRDRDEAEKVMRAHLDQLAGAFWRQKGFPA